MTGAALWFLVGSMLAAACVSLQVRSLPWAVATSVAALAGLWMSSRLGLGFAGKQVTPLITGAGLAAMALGMLFTAKRDAGMKARLFAGVGAALLSHALYLWFALSMT